MMHWLELAGAAALGALLVLAVQGVFLANRAADE